MKKFLLFLTLTCAAVAQVQNSYNDLVDKPTTVAGQGVTNGATIDAWGAKTVPSGTVLGTSDTQTVTNKDISGGTNTYRGATTSTSGAVTLAGSSNAIIGTSTSLVTTVNDAAYMAAVAAGHALGQRNLLPAISLPPLSGSIYNFVSGTTSALNSNLGINVGRQLNLWRYTEDSSYAGYSFDAGTTRTGGTQLTVNGILLTKVTGTSFYSAIRSNIGGLGLTPFTTGKRYMISCYVLSLKERDQFVWTRSLATGGTAAHGPKLLPAGQLRRIWTIAQATSTSALDLGADPAVALGSGSGGQPYWIVNAKSDGDSGGYTGAGDNTFDIRIGGFQIEQISDTAKDGIAMIGDSTMQGASSTNDLCGAREWSGWLAALLNAPTFNRGVSGNKTADMVSRWATDITPLAATAKYVIIQGGLNDISNSVSAATIEANITTMLGYAAADGLIPIVCTITPTTSIAGFGGGEAIRLAVNTWIKQNCPLVLDLSSVVADPYDASQLRRQANWVGDGIHFGSEAKRAVAAYAAVQPWWDLPKPSPYQALATTTYAPPDVSVYGGYKQAMGSNLAANTATLSSGTVTISNTRVTASSKIRLTRQAKGSSTAIGSLTVGTITASTSFVITALKSDGTTETGDLSVVLWEIVEPTS